MIFKIIGGKAVRYDSGGTEKIDDLSVDFSQAESRENISSADNVRTILGKIMKWFSDLSAGAASSLLGRDLVANKALISDANGKVAASAVDASKVGFLSGVTGDVQTQINSLNSAMEISKLRSNIFATTEIIENIDDPKKIGIFVTIPGIEGSNPFGYGVVIAISRNNDVYQFGISYTKGFSTRYYNNGWSNWT